MLFGWVTVTRNSIVLCSISSVWHIWENAFILLDNGFCQVKKNPKKSEVGGCIKPQIGLFFFLEILCFLCFLCFFVVVHISKKNWLYRGLSGWGLAKVFLGFWDFFLLDKTPKVVSAELTTYSARPTVYTGDHFWVRDPNLNKCLEAAYIPHSGCVLTGGSVHRNITKSLTRAHTYCVIVTWVVRFQHINITHFAVFSPIWSFNNII